MVWIRRVVYMLVVALLSRLYPTTSAAFSCPRRSLLLATASSFDSRSAQQKQHKQRGRNRFSSTATTRSTSTTSLRSTSTMSPTTESSSLAADCPSYQSLVTKLQRITNLERAKAVLSYDQLVFMPSAASAERGAQLAALASVLHEQTTSPELLQDIQQATQYLQGVKDTSVFQDERRLLELEDKTFQENARIPSELAQRKAQLSSSAYTAWVQARQDDDFASFAPTLSDCFETAKELADCKRGDHNKDTVSLYTQMLDEFEMGMSASRIDEIFGQIQASLVPLLTKILASPSPPSTEALSKGSFPIDKQQEMSSQIVKALGFDETMGRIDVSVHPFTTSFSPKDVRITSRFSEKEWYQGLAGTIHEGGHAMYEQGLACSSLSLDTALSMGAHESQSLFWERHVGLSLPFWEWATPLVHQSFPHLQDTTPEELYGAVNAVSKGLIRVEADELTYPLHVILRYGIEKDIVGGTMSVEDIPKRWKQEMKDLLDVDVPNDAKGCLQDVHWSALAIGYFPTYLIGAATAAQLEHYIKQDLNFDELVRKGDFAPIKAWLGKKIHRHGKRYPSLDSMLADQLGEKLNPEYLIRYLTDKYTALYKI